MAFSLSVKAKTVLWKLRKNVSLLFWCMLLLLFVLEFFVLRYSIQTVLRFQRQQNEEVKGKGVRVNFQVYDQIVQYIDSADTFEPGSGQRVNPFNIPEKTE